MRIAVYPCRANLWGRRGCSKSQPLAYETSVLPLELHRRITGASSQSLTGLQGIQILRIDGNAYEAKRAPASYRWTTPPKGAPGFEPGFPAAWSGIPDSNWCMQTGSLPS